MLSNFLHILVLTSDLNSGIKGDSVDFAVRLEIATDVAHAVTYLHMYTGVKFLAAFLYV